MEHRWGERFAVDLAVRIAARPFAVRQGRLINLSLSGAAVELTVELRRLSRVQLAWISSHQYAPATPVISAYVVRTYPGGVGLEWCEFAPRAVVELLRAAAPPRSGRGLPVPVEVSPALRAKAASFRHG